MTSFIGKRFSHNGAISSGQVIAFFSLAILARVVWGLEVGDQAPDFELQASDGRVYRLSDYVGKQHVVLAWFPQAFTSGCTIECKSLADSGDELSKFDMTYFMASVDPLEKSTRFAESTGADFPLLSDESMEVARRYGVLYQNRFALRPTFYIDSNGKIAAIDSNVNPVNSGQDMIKKLIELNVGKR
ncbi:MAG: peroxiredoxin [Congregibacter sp.]